MTRPGAGGNIPISTVLMRSGLRQDRDQLLKGNRGVREPKVRFAGFRRATSGTCGAGWSAKPRGRAIASRCGGLPICPVTAGNSSIRAGSRRPRVGVSRNRRGFSGSRRSRRPSGDHAPGFVWPFAGRTTCPIGDWPGEVGRMNKVRNRFGGSAFLFCESPPIPPAEIRRPRASSADSCWMWCTGTRGARPGGHSGTPAGP